MRLITGKGIDKIKIMAETLGHYNIFREIGKGGMGVIYKGLDTKTKKIVAIKVLPAGMVDRSTVARFNRESMALTKLKHPNIIQVFDYGMEKGKHYLVMEFVEGENLKEIIRRRGKFSTNECLAMMSQILSAMEYMHGEGMVHRDIKPSNIMLTTEGIIKVMDFGLVKIFGITNVTIDGTSLGTAEYMSPEQISSEGVDSRTDIYSTGVMMYEMLAGRTPFSGENLQSVLYKQKNETSPPLKSFAPDISDEVATMVEKALSKEVAQRYQTAAELLKSVNSLRGISTHQDKPLSAQASQSKPKEDFKQPKIEKKEIRAPYIPSPTRRIFPGFMAVLAFMAFFGFLIISWDKISGVMESFPVKKLASLGQGRNLLKETQNSLERLEQAEEHYDLGREYFKKGDIVLSIREFERAVKLRKDYSVYYQDLALAYEARKEFKKAIKAWMDLLKYEDNEDNIKEAYQHIGTLTNQ